MKPPPKPVKGLRRGQEISLRLHACPTCGTLQTRRVVFVEWMLDRDDLEFNDLGGEPDLENHPVWYAKIINDKGRIEIVHPDEIKVK